MKRRPVKIKYVKQFCNGCKNQRAFKVKKKLFINLYCFECLVCKKRISYPKRFGKIQEYFFKERKANK